MVFKAMILGDWLLAINKNRYNSILIPKKYAKRPIKLVVKEALPPPPVKRKITICPLRTTDLKE
jgi:hypothetical protein